MKITQSLKQKKQQIFLETAYDLFKKSGFLRVGIDVIVDKSNIAKQTIYNYFGSKENIILLCLEIEINKNKKDIISIIANNNKTSVENLKSLFDFYLEKNSDDQSTQCLITKASIELWHLDKVQEIIKSYQKWKYNIICDLLEPLNLNQEKITIIFNIFNIVLIPSLGFPKNIRWEDLKVLID